MATLEQTQGLSIRDEKDYHRFMSTAELVEQVKALPARERRRFVEIILALEDDLPPQAAASARVKWPDVEARARRIFGNKIIPNLVLLEREESSS